MLRVVFLKLAVNRLYYKYEYQINKHLMNNKRRLNINTGFMWKVCAIMVIAVACQQHMASTTAQNKELDILHFTLFSLSW